MTIVHVTWSKYLPYHVWLKLLKHLCLWNYWANHLWSWYVLPLQNLFKWWSRHCKTLLWLRSSTFLVADNVRWALQDLRSSAFKIYFSKISFRNTIRVANSLELDHEHCSVSPDLDLNSLQRLSEDDKNCWLRNMLFATILFIRETGL